MKLKQSSLAIMQLSMQRCLNGETRQRQLLEVLFSNIFDDLACPHQILIPLSPTLP